MIRWRPTFDRFAVLTLPDGRRRIEATQDGVLIFAETFAIDEANFIAGQLRSEAAPSDAA